MHRERWNRLSTHFDHSSEVVTLSTKPRMLNVSAGHPDQEEGHGLNFTGDGHMGTQSRLGASGLLRCPRVTIAMDLRYSALLLGTCITERSLVQNWAAFQKLNEV